MISVSIVTYNNRDIIGQTVDSLLANLPKGRKMSLWIVDNVSTDGTLGVIEKYVAGGAGIDIIRNERNVGFGSAHNIAINATGSKYHLIMNPDIIVHGDVINRLAGFMDEHDDVGMAVPKILNADGSVQRVNRREPAAFDLFVRRFVPTQLRRPFKKRIDAYEMADVGYSSVYEVPCMSGAFMFCRTSVLKAVGGFDERYFLYFEDYDLSKKIQRSGYRTVFYPDAVATHLWRREAHKNIKMAARFTLSSMKYFNKWGWRLF